MPRTRRIHFFCYSVSGVLLAGVMGWDIQRSAFAAPAEGYASFDINLLRHPSDKKIDVTQFNHRHALPPGAYDVGVMLNNKYVGYTRLQVKKTMKSRLFVLPAR
ncbi:hypothetical protein ERHA55_36410 [Erwinia rhapontici]|nr:hypothetical protein ERHA55_36410 [Erwinia rhapontici]